MRIARTLMVALAAAIAAMALSATTASAQGLEVSNETDAEHCDLIAQNCEIVAHSETETSLRGHLFGFEAQDSICEDEFTGYVGEDGTGHIVDQVLGDHGQCTRAPCGASAPTGEDEWPAALREDNGQLIMEIEFCLEERDGHSGVRHCELDVLVNLDGHHSAEFLSEDSAQNDHHKACHDWTGTGRPEVLGHWVTEPGESDEIEVTH